MTKGTPDLMPQPGNGFVPIKTEGHLRALFHPNRSTANQNDGIVRPSIYIGVRGKDQQVVRFDPFTVDGHYHILPVGGRNPISLTPQSGQTYVDAALAFFDNPNQLRGLLAKGGESEIAAQVTDEEIAKIARQIRKLIA
jgi:hypothetical protein